MSSFWIAAIGIVGTLSAALLTQWLQARAAERQSLEAERRRLAEMKREALAVFAEALMSYRRAQLHNWHVAREQGVDLDKTDVAPETRELRAKAWAAFYRVQLLWREKTVVKGARRLIDAVTDLKGLDVGEAIGDAADQVREELSHVMDGAREVLLTDPREVERPVTTTKRSRLGAGALRKLNTPRRRPSPVRRDSSPG